MENENTENLSDDILTFDEILDDPYYKAEFDRRVQQALDIKNTHSEVKGGQPTMDGQVQTTEGENKEEVAAQPTAAPEATENPAAAPETKTAEQTDAPQPEPAKEMTPEQFEQYNETLRRVSKTAKAGLPDRYNAFEDAEVRATVKQQVMEGKTPDIKALAAEVIAKRTAPAPEPQTETKPQEQPNGDNEVLSLKAENALLKAGILTERIEAATKLFIAEGGDLNKIADFVAKYPEWQKTEGGGVVFTKASPVAGKTAPTPAGQPVLNDFEKKVAAARKARGLDT